MRRAQLTSQRSSFVQRTLVVHTLLAIGLIGAMRPASAHTSSDTVSDNAPTSASQHEHHLPAVTVTSERANGFAPTTVETGPYRGLEALDVPATVNVVTRSVMDAQGDTGLYDALRNVAGVTRLQLNGLAYDNLAIRGI